MQLWILILFALLSTSKAFAAFEVRCIALLADEVIAQKLTYKTGPLVDLEGRPMQRPVYQGPSNINTDLSHFPIAANPNKTNDYNHAVLAGRRVDSPSSAGFFGNGVPEQWLSFVHKYAADILSGIASSQPDLFSKPQLDLLQRIVKASQLPSGLTMVDEPSQFDIPGEPQRFARTTGEVRSPIYINATHLAQPITLEKTINGDLKFSEGSPQNLDLDPVAPFVAIIRDPNQWIEFNTQRSRQQQLASLFGILIHEYGRYLQSPKADMKAVDEIAVIVQRTFGSMLTEVTLDAKNQPWLKFLRVNSGKNKGRLLLMDQMDLYDLTDSILAHVRKQTGKSVEDYSIENLAWEDPHTVDLRHFTTPDVLEVDIILHEVGGDVVVPLRIASYFSASQQSGLTPAEAKAPWRFLPVKLATPGFFKMAEVLILKSKIRKLSDFVMPKTITRILFDRTSFRPQETWTVTAEIDLETTQIPKKATLYFSSEDFVRSGFIQRAMIPFDKVIIEPIGAKKILLHANYKVPSNIKAGKYFVAKATLDFTKTSMDYLPQEKNEISFLGPTSINEKLNWFGATDAQFEPPKLNPVQPRALYRLDENGPLSNGALFPLTFEFENLSTLTRLSLHGHVNFRAGPQGGKVAGFHANALGPDLSPFIHDIKIESRGNRQQVTIYFRVPKSIHSEPIEALFVDSVYVQDKNLREVFDPSPIGIAVDLHPLPH